MKVVGTLREWIVHIPEDLAEDNRWEERKD